MKYLFVYMATCALMLLSQPTMAVSPEHCALNFAHTTHDFGTIAEDGGSVRCIFTATNTASHSVEVTEVVTTCGCTKANYRLGIVAPSEVFSFEVSFDPMNRPGRIDKSIYVSISSEAEPIRLGIVGYVSPRERSVDELYPFDLGGGLRLMSNFHAFGYVEAGKSVEERIAFINTSAESITLTATITESSGLLEVIAPESIAPQATGSILLRYTNPTVGTKYGSLNDRIVLYMNGIKGAYDLSSYAIGVDNFDLVDDISAPRLAISKNIIKFGEVNDRNEVMERSVELRNEGTSPLVVRAIECSAAAVEVVGADIASIAPNESVELVVRLSAKRIEDWDNPLVVRVMLTTNDPLRPMQTIRITALPHED